MVDASKTSISLPSTLSKQLKKLAKLEHRSLSGIVQEAARYYLRIRAWEDLQRRFSHAAVEAGLQTEANVEQLIETIRTEE
jgi:metal-responsive CopG/Arc/MetJ family transcriptional regulator